MKTLIFFLGLLFLFTFLSTGVYAQVPTLPNNYGTLVAFTGTEYVVQDSNGNVLARSDTPDSIIKTALARGGDIYIEAGQYPLSSAFSGFDLILNTNLKLAQDAAILVPSGYTGFVFRLGNNVNNCVIDGGIVTEAAPVKRGWTGILMQGGQGGVYFNTVQNLFMANPYIGIDFSATTGQWINANTFVNIKEYHYVRGIEFDFSGTPKSSLGFNNNVFRDSQFHSGDMTTYGIKDIQHDNNAFYNVQVWDLPVGASSSTIASSASNTIIIGGQMTHYNFVDNGANTIILDSLHNNLSSDQKLSLDIIKGTSQPALKLPSTISSTPNQVLHMSIPGQQMTTGFVSGNQAQLSISQQRPVEINIYGTVSNPKGSKVDFYFTRPNGVIDKNQAYVKTDGSFYYPVVFDSSSLTGQYKINAQYYSSQLGILYINVTSGQVQIPTVTIPSNPIAPSSNPTVPTPQPANPQPAPISNLVTTIKNDSKLWAQNKTTDDIFASRMQSLINIGIITVPNPILNTVHEIHIPEWFKQTASRWADGLVSSGEFISAVQYLLDNGTMKL
jgi:hypothetical protein